MRGSDPLPGPADQDGAGPSRTCGGAGGGRRRRGWRVGRTGLLVLPSGWAGACRCRAAAWATSTARAEAGTGRRNRRDAVRLRRRIRRRPPGRRPPGWPPDPARRRGAAAASALAACDPVVNLTDPDSGWMPTGKGWIQGYNTQLAVSDDQMRLSSFLCKRLLILVVGAGFLRLGWCAGARRGQAWSVGSAGRRVDRGCAPAGLAEMEEPRRARPPAGHRVTSSRPGKARLSAP